MCCMRLAENTRRKNDAKNCHLSTIAQFCRAVSLQRRHVLTIGKKSVKQHLPHMPSQYGELRPTSSWDLLASLGHPCKFQRVSHLGSVTTWHSSSGCQPNFAALNRGRHLYSAGRPSRWALACIPSFYVIPTFCLWAYLLHENNDCPWLNECWHQHNIFLASEYLDTNAWGPSMPQRHSHLALSIYI